MADPAQILSALRPLHTAPLNGSFPSSIATMAVLGCVTAVSLFHVSRNVLARRLPLRRAALRDLAAARLLPPDKRIAEQAAILRRVSSSGSISHPKP
jgi:hypothetical protein